MSKFQFKLAAESETNTLDSQETGLSDVHDLDLDAAMEELHNDIAQTEIETDRGLDIVQSNTDIAAILAEGEGEEISPVETSLLRVSANLAASGFENDPETLVAATESFMTRSAAIEASESTAATVLANVLDAASNILKKAFASFAFFVESGKRLRVRLTQAQDKVKTLGNSVTISAKASKLLLYGNNQVISNFKELKTQVTVAVDFYTQALKIASDSLKSSKLANIKSWLTIASDNNLENILDILENTTSSLIKAGDMTVRDKFASAILYASKPYMGDSVWTVTVPEKTGNGLSKRTGAMYHLVGSYHVSEDTSNSTGLTGRATAAAGFTQSIPKKDLLSLLDSVMSSTSNLDVYTNLNAKISHLLNLFDAGYFLKRVVSPTTSGKWKALKLIGLPLIMKTARALRSLMLMNLGLLSTMFVKYKKIVTYITTITDNVK